MRTRISFELLWSSADGFYRILFDAVSSSMMINLSENKIGLRDIVGLDSSLILEVDILAEVAQYALTDTIALFKVKERAFVDGFLDTFEVNFRVSGRMFSLCGCGSRLCAKCRERW